MNRPSRLCRGFSLIELMITLVVIGILAMLGAPNYFEYIRSGKRGEAVVTLNDIILAAEEYRSLHNAYPEDLAQLNYNAPVNSLYAYAIAACGAHCITASATVAAGHEDNACHTLELDTTGQRRARDNNDTAVAADRCW